MSSSGTLRDQLGVMGIVDTLRHQEQRLADYLDGKRQQDEIKAKITAYYQAQGIDVTTELIEQGVQQWYQSRLTFNHTPLPWYWRAYLSRRTWLPLFVTGIVLALLLAMTVTGVNQLLSEQRESQVAERDTGMRLMHDNILQTLAEPLPVTQQNDPALVTSLLDEAKQLHAELTKQANALVLPIRTQGTSLVDYEARLEPALFAVVQIHDKTKNFTQIISDIRAVRDFHTNWLAMKADHTGLFSRFAVLSGQHNHIGTLLSLPGTNVTVITQKIATLRASLAQAASVDGDIKALFAMQQRIIDAGLSGQELQDIMDTVQRLMQEYEQLIEVDKDQLAYLEYVANITPLTLTLKINPQNGPRSAIERTYDGRSKAYYGVTQALDPAGKAVPMRIKSREDNTVMTTTTFAILLSDEKYEALRRDKTDDGIINNDVLAIKPRGTLRLTTEQGVSSEFITRW